jgi:hypothetical protein
MSLAVILLNWHNERQTLRCARTIAAWQELSSHLYVVDNESTQATSRTLADALVSADLISSPLNLGYAGGNNLGIRTALAARRSVRSADNPPVPSRAIRGERLSFSSSDANSQRDLAIHPLEATAIPPKGKPAR